MYNYMSCNQMMFGSKVRYGITFKSNQRSFSIYRRKFQHNFNVPVVDDNLEGSIGLELATQNAFLCTKVDKIIVYNSIDFKMMCEMPIKLYPTQTREPNEIIAMQKCQNEVYIAVISGKNLIRNEQVANQLFIFKKRDKSDKEPEGSRAADGSMLN